MDIRSKILSAAALVYGECGFRGATTRRIAGAAGVNEVTLFRLFGSKATLIDEALRAHAGGEQGQKLPDLPNVPLDPPSELTIWATAQLDHLRQARSMIRKSMAELEERPEAACRSAETTSGAGHELRLYMQRLVAHGWVSCAHAAERTAGRAPQRDESMYAAGAMLMAALFADAMVRDIKPDLYPQPMERAAELYVHGFLRAIGCRARAVKSNGRANGASGSAASKGASSSAGTSAHRVRSTRSSARSTNSHKSKKARS
jgi:AcrR family transcriptional regulator